MYLKANLSKNSKMALKFLQAKRLWMIKTVKILF